MSQIHLCNDGTSDWTDRGTKGKIPCVNQGGEVGVQKPIMPAPSTRPYTPFSCAQVYGKGSVKSTMPIGTTNTMTSVCEDGYEKKNGKAGNCCVPLSKVDKNAPPLGKYRLTEDYRGSFCSIVGGRGFTGCLKWGNINLKAGEVVDITKTYFIGCKGNTAGCVGSYSGQFVLNGNNHSIDLRKAEKVSDTATENTVEEKPKTFIEKNSNLLIVGGIILGALLLTRK